MMDEKVVLEAVRTDKRLGHTELFRKLMLVAYTAMEKENRCALVSGMASVFSGMKIDEELINKFFTIQIDKDVDCGNCQRCGDLYRDTHLKQFGAVAKRAVS